MNPEQWSAVDSYIENLLLPRDPILEAALQASATAGLPSIQVSPAQGKLLQILARLARARSILEIGTLGGYSTIWLARALPDGGRLISLEVEPTHAEVARSNIDRAGLGDRVEVRLGRASDTLQALTNESPGMFDFIFIDADKAGTPGYFSLALKLSHPGSLIVVDNVVRRGGIIDASSSDPSIQGMRQFCDLLATEPRVSATIVQTVGTKGYDGFAAAWVIG